MMGIVYSYWAMFLLNIYPVTVVSLHQIAVDKHYKKLMYQKMGISERIPRLVFTLSQWLFSLKTFSLFYTACSSNKDLSSEAISVLAIQFTALVTGQTSLAHKAYNVNGIDN